MLSPSKLQVFLLGKQILDLIMSALDDHVVKPRPLQDVGGGGGQTKWVDGPPIIRPVPFQVNLAPLMTYKKYIAKECLTQIWLPIVITLLPVTSTMKIWLV